MYKDIDNLQGSACNYNQGFLTKRNSSNSFKSTMESCKSSQDQNKHSEMKSQDKKKSGSKWNIEGSLSSLDSVSNSSEASINEDAQPNVNHRCQYNNLMNRRMSEAGPRYRAFEKVCPNTLILLNEIERLKLKNEKLGSKLITLSSKNIFGHS